MPRKYVGELGTRTYVNYKVEVLEKCLRAITTKTTTQRAASAHFNIPRSTIKNKLKKNTVRTLAVLQLLVQQRKLALSNIVLNWQISGFP